MKENFVKLYYDNVVKVIENEREKVKKARLTKKQKDEMIKKYDDLLYQKYLKLEQIIDEEYNNSWSFLLRKKELVSQVRLQIQIYVI